MPRLWAQWLYAFHRPKRSLARRLHVLRMHRCGALARHARGEARALLRQIAKLYGTQACESASDMQDLEWDPEPAGSKHGSWGLGGFWQALPTPCPAMAPATAYCEYPEGSLCQKAAVSVRFAVCEGKGSGRRAGEDRGRAVRCAVLPRRRCATDFGLVGPTLRPTRQ
jgi:hypothetical protein